jgi:beta-N-acetylhexosaminidase
MGFSGLIVSDALDMKAISRDLYPGEASVRAILAGCDVVIVSHRIASECFSALASAVQTGRISARRLDESVGRVMSAKARSGLGSEPLVDADAADSLTGTADHFDASLRAAREAVTLISRGPIPLESNDGPFLFVLQRPFSGVPHYPSAAYGLIERLKARIPEMAYAEIGHTPTAAEAADALRRAATAETVIVATARVPEGGYARVPTPLSTLLSGLKRRGKKVVLLLPGSPTQALNVPATDGALCCFGDTAAPMEAVTEALFGEIEPEGKLPVTLRPVFNDSPV